MSQFSRRQFMRAAALSAAGVSFSGWMPRLARAAAGDPARRRHCVLLWMPGGPSQMDTFDLKPGHANGGPFKEIETSVPGLKISEHLPKLAAMAENLAIVRSLSTSEGDHNRGIHPLKLTPAALSATARMNCRRENWDILHLNG